MKFLKRALITVAALGVILVPSVAWAAAGDSVSVNTWFRTPPTDNLGNVLDLITSRSTSRVDRNQTVYWPLFRDGSDLKVVQDGSAVICVVDNTCASAPLFIASQTARICIDSEMGDSAASAAVVDVYTCADSTCAKATSIAGTQLAAGVTGICAEVGNTDSYDGANAGGSWIYVNVSTTSGTTGDTVLVWVTGN